MITLLLHVRLYDPPNWRSLSFFPDFSQNSPALDPTDPSVYCALPDAICSAAKFDSFLFALACWTSLQLPWTLILFLSQLWQICRQVTTLEVSNLGRYGWMGGRGGQSLATQQGAHRHSRAAALGEEDSDLPSAHGHTHAHRGGSNFLMHLLGLDRFTKGKATEGLARSRKAANPFDLGCIGNCRDFWTTGREVGVDYTRLYDVPVEGFREAKRRVKVRMEEEGFDESAGRRWSDASLGLSILSGGRSRDGYAPVRTNEDNV